MPDGAGDVLGPGAEPVRPDLQDAVTVAILAREPGAAPAPAASGTATSGTTTRKDG
jgi:hypothetical protein